MQGYLDLLEKPRWIGEEKVLTGTSKVIGGEEYRVVIACNGLSTVAASAGQATATIKPLPGVDGLAMLAIASKDNADVKWEIQFK
jgi:hypothetical protein